MGIPLPMVGSKTAAPATLPSLFGKTRQALLSHLYGRADEAHLQESLIQLAALGRGTVQRELEFLARAGVVRRTVRGRQVYFQARTAGRIHVAFIYGSIAKGRERRASDVDVMVIGEVSFAETSDALARTQSAIGREVNPSVYPRGEFRAKLGAKHHFLRSVLKSEKIFLIGNQRELARLAKA